jgi:putative transport protein
MLWFWQLIHEDSVAHSVIIISLVIALGLILGRISLLGIRMGISGVFFSGLLFGHFQLHFNPEVLHFLREFGLILFVYAIGLQVGPSFVSSFFQNGLRLNALAASVVGLGALLTALISVLGDIPMPVAVGLFSGGTTNTPSLAAAQQVLASLPEQSAANLKMPGLGFGVSYPFGIIGITLTMLLMKRIFRVNITAEAEDFAHQQHQLAHIPVCVDLIVENPNLQNLTVAQIPFFEHMQVVMTRILHHEESEVHLADPDTTLQLGDTIRLVGDKEQLEKLKIIIGPPANIDLKEIAKHLHSKRLVVTNKQVIRQTIGALCLQYGVTISRIHRPDVEFSPSPAVHVHFGDELHVVGSQESLNNIEKALGNALDELSHPQIMPIFIGICLGVVLGSWPFYLPGIPSALKLGMAGGPLLMAILLSRVGNWGTLSWHLPKSSNMILKDMGIVLFLGCVGMQSGDQFVETLLHGQGGYWMACAMLITLIPLISVSLVARLVFKLNFLSLCGLLSGSMTYPPALPFRSTPAQTAPVSIAYATVYPLVMILRIIAAQLLVLLMAV